MPSFRLITEGVTDQITLEILLSIFYDDPDIDVERLQPPGDETDRYKQKKGQYGGWLMIFQYLESIEFREAVDFADYFIIQIDTDVSQEFNVPHQVAGKDLTPEEIFKRVKEKLVSKIDNEIYNTFKSKFLFTICIHSIECWFLPLYFTDNRKSKIVNCLETLNRQLARREGFTIERNKKDPRYYERITKKFRDKRNLLKLANNNPSFKLFLDNLPGIE